MRRDVCVFIGFAFGLLFTSVYRPAHQPIGESTVAMAGDRIPLDVSRQQLLDAISADNELEPVVGQPPSRYVVELNKSGATVAIDGPADAPRAVTLTTPYNNDTASFAATVARRLATAILGDDTTYGEWAGKAIHKCEPGFEVVGDFQATGLNPSNVEVKMGRAVVNGVDVLAISFRRTK